MAMLRTPKRVQVLQVYLDVALEYHGFLQYCLSTVPMTLGYLNVFQNGVSTVLTPPCPIKLNSPESHIG